MHCWWVIAHFHALVAEGGGLIMRIRSGLQFATALRLLVIAPVPPGPTQTATGAFLRAVLCVRGSSFESARAHVERARDLMSTEFAALVGGCWGARGGLWGCTPAGSPASLPACATVGQWVESSRTHNALVGQHTLHACLDLRKNN